MFSKKRARFVKIDEDTYNELLHEYDPDDTSSGQENEQNKE